MYMYMYGSLSKTKKNWGCYHYADNEINQWKIILFASHELKYCMNNSDSLRTENF